MFICVALVLLLQISLLSCFRIISNEQARIKKHARRVLINFHRTFPIARQLHFPITPRYDDLSLRTTEASIDKCQDPFCSRIFQGPRLPFRNFPLTTSRHTFDF